jgi:SAM-dependent methyltransferase
MQSFWKAMTSNETQADYWSSAPGLKWIRFEEELDLVFENVNAALIQRANPKPGERVLDIGCGTGATTRAFAAHLAPGGSATALDISEPLLSHANSRAGEAPVTNQYFLVDAQQDPIPCAPFDIAISRFGVMFFSDPVAAFRNIRKTLRPDGRLVIAAWAPIKGNPWFEAPRDGAVGRLGPADTSDPNAPGPLGFQNVGHVTGILKDAGFQQVVGETSEIVLAHPGPLDRIATLASNIGPAARILKKYCGDEDDIAAIKSYVLGEFRPYETLGGFRIPARLNFFGALNPG